MSTATDEQTAAAPSVRTEVPGPRADAAERRGDAGKLFPPAKKWKPPADRLPSLLVAGVIAALTGLSIWPA